MVKPRLLDLFCGAGGASMGYSYAGFTVVGVDLYPQKHYPFNFIQSDAIKYLEANGKYFDVIHASPPCQKYSQMTKGRWQDREHVDLVDPVRQLLEVEDCLYVIENVIGAPLIRDPLMLCGTMFNLQTQEGSQLQRHRLFEFSGFHCDPPGECKHNDGSPIGVYGEGQHPLRRRPATIGVWENSGGYSKRDNIYHYGIAARKEVMQIDWMNGKELSESIPPAYTRYIGEHILQELS